MWLMSLWRGRVWTRDTSRGSIQFSHSVVSDSLGPHGLKYTRFPCPSPTPRAYINSRPLSQRCHPTISSSVVPFSSHLQLMMWKDTDRRCSSQAKERELGQILPPQPSESTNAASTLTLDLQAPGLWHVCGLGQLICSVLLWQPWQTNRVGKLRPKPKSVPRPPAVRQDGQCFWAGLFRYEKSQHWRLFSRGFSVSFTCDPFFIKELSSFSCDSVLYSTNIFV